ncbi:MAG: hypothetical protein R3B96_08140 [Pirellulaceae bacterium]
MAKGRTHGSLHVADLDLEGDPLRLPERALASFDQLDIERLLESVILRAFVHDTGLDTAWSRSQAAARDRFPWPSSGHPPSEPWSYRSTRPTISLIEAEIC